MARYGASVENEQKICKELTDIIDLHEVILSAEKEIRAFACLNPSELFDTYFDKMSADIRGIYGHAPDGKLVTFISYHQWGSRGPSQMTVWVNL